MHSRDITILIVSLWFNIVHCSSLFQYFLSIYYSPYSSWKFVCCNIKWSRDLSNKGTKIRNRDGITAPLYEKSSIIWYRVNALLHSRAGIQLHMIKNSVKVGMLFVSLCPYEDDQNRFHSHFLVRFLIACNCTCACTHRGKQVILTF